MKNKLLAIAILLIAGRESFAQTSWQKDGVVVNTVTTAVPFLRINPDARAGGMGDVGLATPADPNSLFVNPSRMAFNERDFGFAVSFTPWLKALVNDIYMASLAGYYKVKEKQTVQIGLKYFSLGNITFTDNSGQEIGQYRPQEFAIDAGYARRLSDDFSIALSLRFIYSNLTNVGIDGVPTFPGYAGAGDISWSYQHTFTGKNSKMGHEVLAGMNISNIGNKISYTRNPKNADYLPTNLGMGLGYRLHVNDKNAIGLYMDVNRLMVPTPQPQTIDSINGGAGKNPEYDKNGDGIGDWKQKSSIAGMFTSFADAPGQMQLDDNGNIIRKKGSRALEELRETTVGIGIEYMYNKQFGVRFGYFHEAASKGNRQFLTAGLTVKYSIVGLNFSYLIPTTIQRNPLDNTLRFSLLFDFKKGGKKADGSSSGISFVEPTPKKKKVKGEDAPKTDQPAQPKEEKKEEPAKEMKLQPIEPK